MKSIIITGGAGFIGYHLAKKYSRKKFKIFILDNFQRGKKDKFLNKLNKNKNIKLISVDLSKPFNLMIDNITKVFHLAAIVGVSNVNKSPIKTFKKNTLSLINTIDFLKRKNFKGKFIFFSTSEVYSPLIFKNIGHQLPTERDDLLISNKLIDRDSYYISKIFGEKYTQFSNINYLILRPHNIYGPRMGTSHVIPELLEKAKKNKILKIYSPNHTRSFCYIDDAINQIIQISNSKNKNQIFNIGNNKEEIKIKDLAKKILSLLKINKKIIFEKNTEGSPPRRVPKIKKILSKIRIKKFVSLENGIKKMLEWE